MNRIYGTDGNVYETSISNGKENTSLKNEKEEFASEELKNIKEEIENMWIKSAKDLRTGEVIYENLCEHSEVLEIIDKHISELKGENK